MTRSDQSQPSLVDMLQSQLESVPPTIEEAIAITETIAAVRKSLSPGASQDVQQ